MAFPQRSLRLAAGGASRAAPLNEAAVRHQALRLLARREYSRVELRQKLLAARRPTGWGARARGASVVEPVDGARNLDSGDDECLQGQIATANEALVDQVLDGLEAERLLSDQRLAEAVVRGGAARLGAARLSQSLKQKGIAPSLVEAVLSPVRETERDRAMALWQRRFGQAPHDPQSRARQHRFLLARGFGSATVAWVLKSVQRAGSRGADDESAQTVDLDDLPLDDGDFDDVGTGDVSG